MNRSMEEKDSPTVFLNLHQYCHKSSPDHSAVQHHPTTTPSDELDIKKQPITTNDRESFEVVRRRRGRPPGFKNKQKPPASSTDKGTEPCMSPHVLEVVHGSDVIAVVTRFCNHRKTGLFILSGSGSVCNVSMQQQNGAIFGGRFSLLSISATILPPSSPISTSLLTTSNNNNCQYLAKFAVSLAGPDGRMFGGTVVGPLIASGTVYIVAATFKNPLYHRLPRMEEDDNHIRNSGYGSVSAAFDQSPAGSGGGDSRLQHHAALPLSMYGGHFPTDVILALTQRQAPPHSSLY